MSQQKYKKKFSKRQTHKNEKKTMADVIHQGFTKSVFYCSVRCQGGGLGSSVVFIPLCIVSIHICVLSVTFIQVINHFRGVFSQDSLARIGNTPGSHMHNCIRRRCLIIFTPMDFSIKIMQLSRWYTVYILFCLI